MPDDPSEDAATPSHTWSLHYELAVIEGAVEGSATVLARVHDAPGDELALAERVNEAESILALTARRLHDLGRVLRGELDPALLAATHNATDVDDHPVNTGSDVVFGPRAAR